MKKLSDFLAQFNYDYLYEGDTIVINMTKKFIVTVLLKNGVYSIESRTKAWSPLSGSFNMSIYKSLVVNSIGLIIAFVGLELLKFSKYQFDYTYLLIIAISLYMMWLFYYLVKFEFLKLKIEQILNEKEI